MKQNVERNFKGMNQDSAPLDQTKQSYRYAQNAINETNEGEQFFISNEPSNELCGEISQGFFPIGSVYTENDEVIVFSVNPETNVSEIGIIDFKCDYTPVVTSSCLNFSISHQIDVTYRLRRGCQKVVYFTDNLNPVRYFNFGNQDAFYSDAYKAYLEDPVGEFEGEKWECELFSLSPSYIVPCFSNANTITGGVLKAGTYNIGIQYVTEDLNATNWIYSSQLINIYHDELDSAFLGIEGSSNYTDDQIAGRVNPTTKAIQVNLTNLDSRYTYYRLAFIQATTTSGFVDKILVSPEIPITQEEFIYTGELSGFTEITEEEFKIGKLDIETAKHIEQLENRLIIANIRGKQVNFCSFQRYASKIASRYVVKEVPIQDQLVHGNSKNPFTPFDSLSFMGGEVYAFGIVYVFKDGTETPAYHIPGRAKDQVYNWLTEECEDTTDSEVVDTWTPDIEHLVPFADAATYDALPDNQKIEKWRVYETAIKVDSDEGHMAYWQTMISFYDKIEDCQEGDYWGVDACGNPLVNMPIRHHRFPSRYLEPHVDINGNYETRSKLIYSISLNEGEIFPAPTVTINIDYDYNGIPQPTYTLIFAAGDLPITNFIIDEQVGDTSVFSNIVVTGDITTYPVLTYSTDVQNSSTQFTDDSLARLLGVQFSNIEYPHTDIVGHYFVRADRDEINRTILDKGIFGRMREKDLTPFNYLTFSYFTRYNNSQFNGWLFTPRFLFNRDALSPEYIKIENQFSYQKKTLGSEVYDGIGGIIKETDTIIEHRTQTYNGLALAPILVDRNIKRDKTRIMDGLSYDDNYIANRRTYNLSHSNRVQVFSTTNTQALPNVGNDILFVSLRVDRNVHPSLENIKYYRMHNCMFKEDSDARIFGGDVYIFASPMSNTLFREFFQSAIGAFVTAIIIVGAAVASVFTAGAAGAAIAGIAAAIGIAASATVITTAIIVTAVVAAVIGVTSTLVNAAIKAYAETNLDEMAEDPELDGLRVKASSFVAYANEHITGIYGESEVNMDLRQTEYHICGAFYKYGEYIGDYFRQKIMFFDEEKEKWYAKTITCPEIYHLNKDYMRENRQSVYFPLSKSYDCCSDCLETHPTRVHYSEQSFQEEVEDSFRIFLSNNYRDIESEHGEITDLFRKHNSLFIHTKEALWQLPQNIQERITGEVISFVGTGSYFSIPPRAVLDSDLGSAGTIHKWATVKTSFGVYFVTELEGNVYVLSGSEGIKNISAEGMSNWFAENLKPFFERQFKTLTNTDFPLVNNPANPYGIGIHSTFDQRHSRIIFTKKDYLILPAFVNHFIIADPTVVLNSNRLFFDPTTQQFGFSVDGITWEWILPTNPDYFENKSWTMSYSLLTNSWVSFHSYLPNYYIQTQSDFYSFIDSQIWKHNLQGNFQKFYGTLYPHILEYVSLSNPITTRLWEDITIQTIAGRYNSQLKEYLDIRDITFNFIVVYNSRQSSGELEMVVKDTQPNEEDYLLQQITDQSGIILISRNERNWNINDFRDYVNDYLQPMFTRDWDSIKSLFPIDKVVNDSVIDFNKDWYDLESFRDKYLIVRLKFANFEDVKLTTNYNLETEQDSFR